MCEGAVARSTIRYGSYTIMFKALKDAKRRVVQTVYEKTTNAVEKTIDERTDRNFSNFCEMIDDMNECGAGYHTHTPLRNVALSIRVSLIYLYFIRYIEQWRL